MTFKPGKSGNPQGRRPGTGHRQLIFNSLLKPHVEGLFTKAIELALNGNEAMLRMFLERILPAKPIDNPISLGFYGNHSHIESFTLSGNIILKAVDEGKISPSEAKTLFDVINKYKDSTFVEKFEDRIENLEKKLTAQRETNQR